ncbi:hypothetical protein LXL81_04875 [Dyadobacter sp. CY356]|nr:hypothetical protein [Dyadobacter sp. CY356]
MTEHTDRYKHDIDPNDAPGSYILKYQIAPNQYMYTYGKLNCLKYARLSKLKK